MKFQSSNSINLQTRFCFQIYLDLLHVALTILKSLILYLTCSGIEGHIDLQ
jgi:hypothetical protein